jgi:hypothetical protein
MNVLHLSAAVRRFEQLLGSPVDSPFCLGRLIVFSQGNDDRASNAPAGKTSRLSSAFVPFSVFQLKPAFIRRQPAFGTIPLQRLLRSCGFLRPLLFASG